MRRRFFVADSSLSRKFPEKGVMRSLVGDEGADLAMEKRLNFGADEEGKSSDTVLLGRDENLGIGKELGGGEFE